MKVYLSPSRIFLPFVRFILAPFPKFRSLLIKTCILLEENRDPEQSLRWLFAVHTFTEEWIDRQAVAWGDGAHMKHKVMDGIHSFFYERIPSGSTVLDVGCGIGAVASEIAQRIEKVQVTGIDFNPDHIRIAREKFQMSNLRFLEGDATRDLPGETADFIVLSSVLEHLTDRVAFLQKLIKRYHPTSVLIRVPTCERHYHAAMKRHLNIFSYVDMDHKTEYTLDQFFKEMTGAGLLVISSETRWGDIWAECRPFERMDCTL